MPFMIVVSATRAGPFGPPNQATNIWDAASMDGATIVAGSNRRAARTLDNGAVWTQEQIPYTSSGVSNLCIAAGGGRFCIGTGNNFNFPQVSILTSADLGVTWTRVSSGISLNNDIRGIAYGGGRWVAVADGGHFAFSDDGINWTPGQSSAVAAAGGGLSRVTYGGGIFVWSSVGALVTSSDGVAWTQRSLPTQVTSGPATLGTSTFGSGAWVIPTSANGFLRSVDGGATWNFLAQSGFPTDGLLQFRNGLWIFARAGGAGVAWSQDSGATWTWQSITMNEVHAATYSTGEFLLFSFTGNQFTYVIDHEDAVEPDPPLSGLACAAVGVDQIVYDLARRAGLPPGRIDVSGIEAGSDYGLIHGFGIGRSASARTMIEILQRAKFFDVTEIGGIVAARRRDRAPDGVIGGDDLRAHAYGETPPTLARRDRIEDYEIPVEVRVEYSQVDAEYEAGVEAYTRRVTDASGVLDVDLSAIAMEPDEAAVIAEATLLEAVIAREGIEGHQVATAANKALKPGDIKTLQVGEREDVVRITDIGYAYPGIQRLKMLRHDPSVYSSDAQGVGRGTPGSVLIQHGTTTFELLDAPLVRELDDVPGYFAALGGIPTIPGILEGWPGGDLSREEAGGPVDILRMFRPACWFGETVTALPADANYTALDWRPVEVTTSGPLETVTLQQALQGRNLAAVEVRSGGERIGWEIIRFLEVDYSSEEVWTINGLIRGVNGTEWAIGLHQDGDRLVVLNNIGQVLTDIDNEQGRFWEHNASTIGGETDPATAVTFGWFGVDRIPYAPVHLEAERDGASVFIRWTRRDRVGMELQNGQTLPMSEAAESYLLTIFNGLGNSILRTATVSTPEYEYTAANELADFGSEQSALNVRVAQIGALGAGYPASGLLQVGGDVPTPPPLPSGDQSRVTITVDGTFSASDTLYFALQFFEAGVGVHNELFTATGGSKSALGDYLTDLSAQVGTAFPGLTRSIVGSTLTISTTAGVLTGNVTNNTAVTTVELAQQAAPVSAGVTYVGTLDFYQSSAGADVVGPSLSTQYGQGGGITARLEVVGITYDAAKAIGPGNLTQFLLSSSHDFGGGATSYLGPLGQSRAAIDAHSGFSAYKASVSLGTISGLTFPPPRDGVVITLQPNHRLVNQFWTTTPNNVSASLVPLKYLVKTNRNAEPAFPSGAAQIVLVTFTTAGDQVATPQSVVAGQIYKITLGATEFSRTVTSGDAADQRRESILQALADAIDADSDFVVDVFTLNRPGDDPMAPGTFIARIEIRHVTANTAFTFDAQASYGIEVSVVNEIIPE